MKKSLFVLPNLNSLGAVSAYWKSLLSKLKNYANFDKKEKMPDLNHQYCRDNYDWKAIEKKVLNLFGDEANRLSK